MADVRPVLIAIDGPSGSGKTTLAIELAAILRRHRQVSLFHLEDIYPGWDGLAAGVSRYSATVVEPLSRGEAARWRAWDWEKKNDADFRTTAVAPVVILEGVGAGHIEAGIDVTIWVDAPSAQRKQRALARDGESYVPFWDMWAAQERELFSSASIANDADVVVDGTAGVISGVDSLGTPELVVQALVALPQLEALLAPELAARRGLEVVVEKHDSHPDAEHLFQALFAGSSSAVWLDSSSAQATDATPKQEATASDSRARFSILADSSGYFSQQAEHRDGLTTVTAGAVSWRVKAPFFRWLDSVWGRKAVKAPHDYPSEFTLGWLGYLGYELKRETGGSSVSASTPDAKLLFASRAVVLDHHQKCCYLLSLREKSNSNSIQQADAWAQASKAALSVLGQSQVPASDFGTFSFSIRDDEASYKTKIAASQQEIFNGNSYEVCLTTTLEGHAGEKFEPLDAYKSLRRRSPAPFAAYLRFGTLALCSSSPERFLRIDAGGAMRAEPIKGTRRRSQDPAADAAVIEDLANSLKDRAENIMIVDLLRNDLSHFAVPGTVSVPRLCVIESYTTVHQLVSTIDAQLAPGSSRAAALAAAFPAGSMTGAPKISTMAILDKLESGPRGAYSGAIGYFSLNAAVDLSVTIRTLVVDGDKLLLGVGGAITSDSDPSAEWDEIQAKAYGVLSTLGADFPD